MERFNKLLEMCKPLVEFLKKHYDPHCTIIISYDCVKVVRDEEGAPVKQ